MDNAIKQSIFKALDARIGQDLITAVYTVRQSFRLSEADFYPIFNEWFNTPSTIGVIK